METQTDHDTLIQLQTIQEQQMDMLADISSHVSVMNSEQGLQGKEIVQMETKLDMMYSLTFAIIVAVAGSLITSVWQLITHYRGKK